jgi:hypothetical protein
MHEAQNTIREIEKEIKSGKGRLSKSDNKTRN